MELSAEQDRTTRLILLSAGLLLLCYTTLRACLLAFTWDESYTFIEFVNTPYWYYTTFNSMSANNHLLNTWLMKLCQDSFGIHELALRLPNLLAHILYLFFSAKLVMMLHKRTLIIAAFILLNTNPFLLDFFTAARGYGIAMGLMMASLYYLFIFIEFRRPLLSFISAALAVLAVLAQYTMLYYMFSVLALMLFIVFIEWIWKRSLTKALFILIISVPLPILLFIWFAPVFIELQRAGAFYYGGDDGFVSNTILTLASASWYQMPYSYYFTDPLIVLVILIYITACVFSCMEVFGRKKHSSGPFLLIATGLLTFSVFWIQYLHFTIDVKFPLDRTGLFFIPLFMLVVIALISLLYETKKMVWPAVILAGGCVLHLIVSFNLYYLLMWKVDADVKTVAHYIERDHPEAVGKVNMEVNYMFEPGLNFYKVKDELGWLNIIRNEQPDTAGYYYMITDMTAGKTPGIEQLLYFRYNGVGLYKKDH